MNHSLKDLDMDDAQTLTLPTAFRCQVKHLPIKRTFDLLFSTSVMILGAPVFLLISLLVACTSKGKVFYSHERVGRGGKPFQCYKFRTMYQKADTKLQEILESDPGLKKEWDKTHKLQKDPRVTPIGAILRKTSLDELPQFWNVLKGDMSIVGPRPVVKEELEKHFNAPAKRILSVRPGITGLWQVSGRSNTSYLFRIQLDEEYVRKRSFLFDLKLILKTIPAVLFFRGAY